MQAIPSGVLYFETLSLPLLTAEGVTIQYDGRQEIHMMMDFGSHSINGIVMNPDGETTGGARIDLMWKHLEYGVLSKSHRITHSLHNGKFVFSQLGSGNHEIKVFTPDYVLWKSHVYISHENEPLEVRLKNPVDN